MSNHLSDEKKEELAKLAKAVSPQTWDFYSEEGHDKNGRLRVSICFDGDSDQDEHICVLESLSKNPDHALAVAEFAAAANPAAISSLIEELKEANEHEAKLEADLDESDTDRIRLEKLLAAAEAERDKLQKALEDLRDGIDAPAYNGQALGCGIEDRDFQEDGYAAAMYGWDDCAMRAAEWIQGVAEAALKNGAGA